MNQIILNAILNASLGQLLHIIEHHKNAFVIEEAANQLIHRPELQIKHLRYAVAWCPPCMEDKLGNALINFPKVQPEDLLFVINLGRDKRVNLSKAIAAAEALIKHPNVSMDDFELLQTTEMSNYLGAVLTETIHQAKLSHPDVSYVDIQNELDRLGDDAGGRVDLQKRFMNDDMVPLMELKWLLRICSDQIKTDLKKKIVEWEAVHSI